MSKKMEELPIVEIFESIQGEGFNTGRKAIFIRLGQCNLKCSWCDTDYNEFILMSFDEIFNKLESFLDTKNIILTGGEPTIHRTLNSFIDRLKENSFKVWIESNGIREIPNTIDYVAISPKRLYQNIYEKHCVTDADEVRIVIDEVEGGFNFCQFIEKKVKSQKYYISPCEVENKIQWADALNVLGRLNERDNKKVDWLLSIQSHKIMDIR
ncbi:7-carboxy-7-deazaguanine synthase QueE [Candidatus Enterococcus ikei]|uniref:7-carboxy-7-deazaguanine synthase n=1 Tax=Candidatus Enterococcus ikei TaxID=2815326 RepID=A0ABS3GWC4_9ENTE|nr:7-carboxy-7-deazaguanine synthase QueE [Enterococcus sp. DIV0869a]MBO0439259.1 7-carboxy-7-deazaguanine synthase QueE [Enterococcus sp. DIV0869a]